MHVKTAGHFRSKWKWTMIQRGQNNEPHAKDEPIRARSFHIYKKKGGWHTHMNLMNFDQLHECGKIWQNNKSSCQNHLGFTYWGWRPDCEVLKYSLDHGFCIFFPPPYHAVALQNEKCWPTIDNGDSCRIASVGLSSRRMIQSSCKP